MGAGAELWGTSPTGTSTKKAPRARFELAT
jgi:hypothetical protein